MLTDSILNMQVTTYTSKTTTISNPNSQLTVKTYGLGFSDVVNTATGMSSGDWERLSLPAAQTFVFDIMSPSIGTFIGINDLTIKANNALTHFASDVSFALQGVNLADKLINGDKKGAITSSIKTTISVLTANDNAILKEIIKECGADAVEAKIISVFVYAKLFLLTANIGDVILSANSLATTKLVETFTIIPSDTTAPTIPTGLTATAASSTQINLSWSASTDAVSVAGYKIYRDGTYSKSVNITSTSDTGLSPATQYCYTVSAYDAAGNVSSQSSSACATTPATADTTAPSNTTASNFINSGASSTSSTSVALAISATDAVSVTAYYASETATTPSASASGWTAVTSTTSYSASVPFALSSTNGTKTIYVWFKDAAGNVSLSANDSINLSTGSTPSAPTGVSATAGNGQVTISWNAVSGATSYNIYWSTTSGVTKTSGTKISNATSPYTHTGRTNGTSYY